MKKVKSLVRRLIGMPVGKVSPITIDICTRTSNGFCVIGWYLSDELASISLKDNQMSKIDATVTTSERADVVAAVKKPALGFQLLCKTSLSIEHLQLSIMLSSGAEHCIPLKLTSSNIITANDADITETSPIASSSEDVSTACELAIIVDKHIFISGWLDDGESLIQAKLVDKKKNLIGELTDQMRCSRNDVREALGNDIKLSSGFMMLFTRVDKTKLKNKELLLIIEIEGREVSIPILKVLSNSSDSAVCLKSLLNTWKAHIPSQLQKSDLFLPIVAGLYPPERDTEVSRIDFGCTLNKPKVSIVIPLYGRFDFLRYQMSHFDRYGEYENVEIIYVVDDPNIVKATLSLARRTSKMVEQPFSLLILADNVGFGKANNIGVAHAQSEYIVLMNSDVLPKNGEWLEKMLCVASYDDAGVVGARLLFEDDTIQHDGMAPMSLAEYPGLLFNDHPRKGWPKSLAHVTQSVAPCDLLTAACWAMKKSLFQQVEGFDAAYVLGDFEDSDLCFKLLALGKINYICRDAELYHLERQSQNLVSSGGWKHNLTILNAVTFNKRWHKQLKALNEELHSNE